MFYRPNNTRHNAQRIRVAGLPPALVVMAFFNVARGRYHRPFMTLTHAQILLALLPQGERIDSWEGVPLGLRFDNRGMLETTYDNHHGSGISRRVIRSLRFHWVREKVRRRIKKVVCW